MYLGGYNSGGRYIILALSVVLKFTNKFFRIPASAVLEFDKLPSVELVVSSAGERRTKDGNIMSIKAVRARAGCYSIHLAAYRIYRPRLTGEFRTPPPPPPQIIRYHCIDWWFVCIHHYNMSLINRIDWLKYRVNGILGKQQMSWNVRDT